MNKVKLITTVLLGFVSVSMSGCAPIIFGGAIAGGAVAVDNRTAGSYVEDQAIEFKAVIELKTDRFSNSRYSVTSINRVVLIVGQATDEDVKADIEKVVSALVNVRRVVNQMTVGPTISLVQQSRDTSITVKVKAKLFGIQEGDFSALDVKVVTEDGVVYLMGLITQQNAAIAIDIARNISGVKRVVQIFEYFK